MKSWVAIVLHKRFVWRRLDQTVPVLPDSRTLAVPHPDCCTHEKGYQITDTLLSKSLRHLQVWIYEVHKWELAHNSATITYQSQKCIFPANETAENQSNWYSRQTDEQNEWIASLHYRHAIIVTYNLERKVRSAMKLHNKLGQ